MGLFSPLLGATLRVFVREIRQTRVVLQHGIDTYRQVHGLPTLFADAEVLEDAEPQIAKGRPAIVGVGDMLTLDILEALAAEQGVKWHDLRDLEAEAYTRGWVDADGKILLVPQRYAGTEFADVGMFR